MFDPNADRIAKNGQTPGSDPYADICGPSRSLATRPKLKKFCFDGWPGHGHRPSIIAESQRSPPISMPNGQATAYDLTEFTVRSSASNLRTLLVQFVHIFGFLFLLGSPLPLQHLLRHLRLRAPFLYHDNLYFELDAFQGQCWALKWPRRSQYRIYHPGCSSAPEIKEWYRVCGIYFFGPESYNMSLYSSPILLQFRQYISGRPLHGPQNSLAKHKC